LLLLQQEVREAIVGHLRGHFIQHLVYEALSY
jgi:hypothetical protein